MSVRLRQFPAVTLLLAASLPALASPEAGTSGVTLTWIHDDGSVGWSAPLDPAPEALTAGGADLVADAWFPRLAELEIELFDDTTFRSAEALGDVLILTFWATWCEPCLTELPLLQSLLETEGHNGLQVIAVNAQEPKVVALPFAERLGLTMPIGVYRSRFYDAVDVVQLPTVILIDRWGRLRARWDGYEAGMEDRIGLRTRELLREAGPPTEVLGRELRKAESFGTVWTRVLEAPIDGLAARAASAQGEARFVAAAARTLFAYGAVGATEEMFGAGLALGRLQSGDLDGDARPDVLSYRPGGTRLVERTGDPSEVRSWSAPLPVLAVEALPPESAEEPAHLLVGTVAGLFSCLPGGASCEPVGEFGEVTDVNVTGGAASQRVLVLEAGGRLTRLDGALQRVSGLEAPGGARTLVTSASRDGVGLLPIEVSAAVSGRFLGGTGEQIAVTTYAGSLILLDAGSGNELFRAAWSGIPEHLAVVDLDGDGRDELAVAAGRRLVVLGRLAADGP